MGQSAGAASILHHITWEGGRSTAPFKGAILQSPGFFPQPTTNQSDETYKEFLNRTGSKDLDDLVTKDSSVLIKANAEMTYLSQYGIFRFGPTIDYNYVPNLPGKMLRDRRFANRVHVLLGHTKFDGLLFTPPWVRSGSAMKEYAKKLYPNITEDNLKKIGNMYPISGLIGGERAKIIGVSDMLDDIAIQCNNVYLTNALLETSQAMVYRYVYNVNPPIHGADVPYTYYEPKDTKAEFEVNATLAKYIQTSIVNFVRYFDPNDEDKEQEWPLYTDKNRRVMNFGSATDIEEPGFDFNTGPDLLGDTYKQRCAFWQDAPYGGSSETSGSRFRDQSRGSKFDLK